MPEELDITTNETILILGIGICITAIIISLILQKRKEPQKPIRPEIITIVLLFGITICLIALYVFEITTWNPIEHPATIVVLGIGIYILQVARLQYLGDKKFHELLEIAKDHLRKDFDVQLSQSSMYNHLTMVSRAVEKGTEKSVMYFLFNVKDCIQTDIVAVLIGLFTDTGGLAFWKIDPPREMLRDIESRARLPEKSAYRQLEESIVKGEKQTETTQE